MARNTNISIKAAILALGFLATSSFLFIEHHALILSWSTGGGAGSDTNGVGSSNKETIPDPSSQQLLVQHANEDADGQRRRLAVRVVDEGTQQKQMKAYLGGLYPPVDKNMQPMYITDVHDDAPLLGGTGRDNDVVFFWHIPKVCFLRSAFPTLAMGSQLVIILLIDTISGIWQYSEEHSELLLRFETGGKGGRPASEFIVHTQSPFYSGSYAHIITHLSLPYLQSMTYARETILNMDTNSPEGLAFSFSSQIVNSGKIDVVVSNYFLSGAALFTDVHHGKAFTILRHPIELALSLFHYRRKASWERSYRKDFMKMTFYDYVDSEYYLDNWMVRQLSGTMPWVKLTERHLDRAKEMMRKKIFIGLMENMDETMRQLKAHYGWEEKQPYCVHNYLHGEKTNENKHAPLQGGKGGKTWNLVASKEKWDMALYYYGLELFTEQNSRYGKFWHPLTEGQTPAPPQDGQPPAQPQQGEPVQPQLR